MRASGPLAATSKSKPPQPTLSLSFSFGEWAKRLDKEEAHRVVLLTFVISSLSFSGLAFALLLMLFTCCSCFDRCCVACARCGSERHQRCCGIGCLRCLTHFRRAFAFNQV